MTEDWPFPTLPDLGEPGLALVYVGINPSLPSVRTGHYFAGPRNRFWPALTRSRLGAGLCEALGVTHLEPSHDALLPPLGIGFTDVVKVPSAGVGALTARDFREWTPRLRERLARWAPRVVCFQGLTGFRPFLRHAMGHDPSRARLGEQDLTLGGARVFVVPNPSPAAAAWSLEDLVAWQDRLADLLERTGVDGPPLPGHVAALWSDADAGPRP